MNTVACVVGLLSSGLSGIAHSLRINSSHALDNLARDLSDLLGLGSSYALGNLDGGFRDGCRNGGCDLRGAGWSH